MPPTKMTDEHKAALAEGRAQAAAVRRYLEALEAHRPRRGRKRTPESVRQRLAAVDSSLSTATAMSRLELMQERRDLQAELERLESTGPDLAALEAEFCANAAGYAARKGIEYATWREYGITPSVLAAAGIGR